MILFLVGYYNTYFYVIETYEYQKVIVRLYMMYKAQQRSLFIVSKSFQILRCPAIKDEKLQFYCYLKRKSHWNLTSFYFGIMLRHKDNMKLQINPRKEYNKIAF